MLTSDASRNLHDACEALRGINHLTPGELSITELYSIVGSLDLLMYSLPQTLSTVASHVEKLSDDLTLVHDGTAGSGSADRTGAERAIAAALNIDRALVDALALNRAHSDLGTLKRATR